MRENVSGIRQMGLTIHIRMNIKTIIYCHKLLYYYCLFDTSMINVNKDGTVRGV